MDPFLNWPDMKTPQVQVVAFAGAGLSMVDREAKSMLGKRFWSIAGSWGTASIVLIIRATKTTLVYMVDGF